jgi:FtsZ-interacting cell division protein ZipA
MKIIVSMLLIISTLIVGCDRETLDGLNLKINTEVNSDYDKEKSTSAETNKTKVSTEVVEKEETPSEEKASESEQESTQEVVENKEEKEVNKITENDPDQPMSFKEISECSKAGITAKTNEIFYADNPQVKSIDSKNEKQLQAWKKIFYTEVEKNCNN